MPVSLLIALLLAFGVDGPRGRVPAGDVATVLGFMLGGVALTAALAFGLGFWAAHRVSRAGHVSNPVRRRFTLGSRLITVLSLVVYAWIIHSLGWSRLVLSNWGLRGWILLDDLAIFFPFLAIQVLVWSGLFAGERALRVGAGDLAGGLGRHLVLRTRQSIGLVMPVIVLYLARHDLIDKVWPRWARYQVAEPLEVSVLGALVLLISPVFVRIAWPTHSLPPGPLRERLESAADRVGFKFTDILVWDTGNMMVNACVTGILPGFRYVLLTDALIETMTPYEAAAVFGHEVGHVVHRHLLYFGFFFVGSLGVLSLMATGVESTAPMFDWLGRALSAPSGLVSETGQGLALLILLGVYFWVVFGRLSRRFERQADVFGAKFVSCQTAVCPPHIEPDLAASESSQSAHSLKLCPVGVRRFADALAGVAIHNGLDPAGRSWRHGSIASRLDFLGWLERNPAAEQSFQTSVFRFRVGLGLVLLLAVVLSIISSLWSGGF